MWVDSIFLEQRKEDFSDVSVKHSARAGTSFRKKEYSAGQPVADKRNKDCLRCAPSQKSLVCSNY